MLRHFRIACLLAIGSTFMVAGAQRPSSWQRFSNPTVEQLRKTWRTPPPEYGPEPYYGLNGPITIESVRHDLDTMVQLGFHAVTVQGGRNAELPYLSPEYFNFFKQFVEEAKRRNLRIWIVDDAGYPSGFAGGKISSDHPDLRMQALVAVSHSTISGGASFSQAVTPATVAVAAMRADGKSVQLPISDGHVSWTAPSGSGSWTVYIVEHQFRTSPTRSDTNPKAVKDTSQSLEDYLDPNATAEYLKITHEAYFKAVGDEFGKTILGFRGDEPDYSISGLPWTPALFDRFQKEKGYDPRPWLAALLQGKDIALTAEQLRAKADYYDVFAEMFRDGFFKPQADWCTAHGVEYQVHLNHEEMQLQLARSEGDFFRDMRYVQVPGIDAIWHQIWTDTVSDYPRLASSAAHVYGHPRVFTESFAAYRPLPDVPMARYILNEQFVRGINLVETMYYPSTTTSGKGGPIEFMRDPGYPALMHDASRMSYILSQGRPAAQVALLLPAESLWMGSAKTDDTFVSMERVLSEHQIDFDIVDEDAVGHLLKAEPGAFRSDSGNAYKTVIVPHAILLPQTVVERLRAFAKTGGHVLFIGAVPSFIAGRTDLQARSTKSEDFAWANIVPVDLAPTPTPPQFPPAAPPAPLETPAPLLQQLKASIPKQGVELAEPDPALRVEMRTIRNGQVILLFNEGSRTLDNRLLLNLKAQKVERWNPETGETETLQIDTLKPYSSLPLHLSAYATLLLVVQGKA
ncbi:glycosyl hydrolase [Silvibacterium dinghuense]|uniref:Beta-galactosidase n=1 Tax=Silvibacterium dinghuense TaxID=1560006 RepID=A0A4Q1SBB0_9BACT|nr:glycosyl hydrolase [Silvibacterium dinghuense]RXS94273.1 beta-galactosidase [Silvibacterium dinghuense]GGH17261.1 glycosyl hydrolase family 2 [Silvibacterium dinghuense]